MHYPNTVFSPAQALESATSGRLVAICWIAAACGAAVAQVTLLALIWSRFHHAFPTACIAGAWICGGIIGLLLVLPLIGLEFYPSARSPFPARRGIVDALVERSADDPPTWLPIGLECGAGTPWWCLAYLNRRRHIPPTLLALGLAVGAGAIWYSVPTPFAAHLVRSHQVWALSWLVAVQLAALALCWYLFAKCWCVLGVPDRLIPLSGHHCGLLRSGRLNATGSLRLRAFDT